MEAPLARAIALLRNGKSEDAETILDVLLEGDPQNATVLNLKGVALSKRRCFTEAIAFFAQAIAHDPALAHAYFNYGQCLQSLQRDQEALYYYNKTLLLDPAYFRAYFNRGIAYNCLGHYKQAQADFSNTISLAPHFADAYFFKGLATLVQGQFEEGWKLYEWRHKRTGSKPERRFTSTRWTGGESLRGKTLLLYSEQGLGDAIQFCRYVPIAASLGARIVLEVPRSLAELLLTLHASATIIARGDTLPECDFHCPLMSLPLMFNTTLNTIPSVTPYLSVPPERKAQWSVLLGKKERLRIGVAWSGSPAHRNNHNRSIALQRLSPLLSEQHEYFCIQKEITQDENEFLKTHNIPAYVGYLHSFADTAALLSQMDVIISVDTAVAHLAGALGLPVWIMLPYAPDFRWLTTRATSPWYPSAVLFRQPTLGDWSSVIASVTSQLQTL